MVNVEIRRPQKECIEALGAGFLLDSEIAITAAHCVKDVTEPTPESRKGTRKGQVRVFILTESEDEILLTADVTADETMDIAIIKFPNKPFKLDEFVARHSSNVSRGTAWIVQSVFSHMATLEGSVADPQKRYTLHSGHTTQAIQLTCNMHLTTHEGYSGSALQLENGRKPWPVAGMMIEQYLDPGLEQKSANILFALSIGTIAKSSVYNEVAFKGVGVCLTQRDSHDLRTRTLEVARARALEAEGVREEIFERRSAYLEELCKKYPATPAEFAMAYLMHDIDLDFEGAAK